MIAKILLSFNFIFADTISMLEKIGVTPDMQFAIILAILIGMIAGYYFKVYKKLIDIRAQILIDEARLDAISKECESRKIEMASIISTVNSRMEICEEVVANNNKTQNENINANRKEMTGYLFDFLTKFKEIG